MASNAGFHLQSGGSGQLRQCCAISGAAGIERFSGRTTCNFKVGVDIGEHQLCARPERLLQDQPNSMRWT